MNCNYNLSNERFKLDQIFKKIDIQEENFYISVIVGKSLATKNDQLSKHYSEDIIYFKFINLDLYLLTRLFALAFYTLFQDI